MIKNGVISIQSAETILSHLVEAKDRDVIGDSVWCKVALSVLQHVLFSDLTPLCHEVVEIGFQKSARLISATEKYSTEDGTKYRTEFESVERYFRSSKNEGR